MVLSGGIRHGSVTLTGTASVVTVSRASSDCYHGNREHHHTGVSGGIGSTLCSVMTTRCKKCLVVFKMMVLFTVLVYANRFFIVVLFLLCFILVICEIS